MQVNGEVNIQLTRQNRVTLNKSALAPLFSRLPHGADHLPANRNSRRTSVELTHSTHAILASDCCDTRSETESGRTTGGAVPAVTRVGTGARRALNLPAAASFDCPLTTDGPIRGSLSRAAAAAAAVASAGGCCCCYCSRRRHDEMAERPHPRSVLSTVERGRTYLGPIKQSNVHRIA
jgi:hypothetical protein